MSETQDASLEPISPMDRLENRQNAVLEQLGELEQQIEAVLTRYAACRAAQDSEPSEEAPEATAQDLPKAA